MKRYAIRKYFILVCSFSALGFLIAVGVRAAMFSEKSAPASIGIVKKQDLIQRVTVAGKLIPFKRTVITAPYNGYIKKLYVQIGQKVQAGDPIVSLVQSLHGEEVYPLRAPFGGTVVQVLKTEGEYVEQMKETSSMVRIDDLSHLYVVADVPESDVERIRIGDEAQIKASAVPARNYKGVIREMSLAAKEKPSGWSSTGDRVEFTVKMEVIDKDDQIKSGMSMLVDIVTNKKLNVLTLRHEYIKKIRDKYSVTLENGLSREVEVGLQNEDMFEVKKGLREGERVKMVDFQALVDEEK